jgi:hypothetical protein
MLFYNCDIDVCCYIFNIIFIIKEPPPHHLDLAELAPA